MTRQEIIAETEAFVQASMAGAEAGHDWWHSVRVRRNAKTIGIAENADLFIVELAALLHDIADPKFHGGNEQTGAARASAFLHGLGVEAPAIDHVSRIIANVSFKGGNAVQSFQSTELAVVQDADRLDAIGAIGVARAFNYGGFKGRELYNPEIAPVYGMSPGEYRASTAPTINHFYEKLLLLKDRMNTPTGKKMAENRHRFLVDFLERFIREWEGQE